VIQLSPDQQKTLNILFDWFNSVQSKGGQNFITVGGYAGTGKTTLLAYLRNLIQKQNPATKVAFASYTGKATQVMKNKLTATKQLQKRDFIGTIHSLIYDTIEDERGVVLGWELKDSKDVVYDLLVIDEASMVDEKIWHDLLYFGIPVVAVGDHGQLPPISGNFNLMKSPQLKLEKIHRQAENNPIIKVSIYAREQGAIPHEQFDEKVVKHKFSESGYLVEEALQSYNPQTLFLCGYNSSRVKINKVIRANLGFELSAPLPGDRVICLRNNHKKRIFNGMLGELIQLERHGDDSYLAEIEMENGFGEPPLLYRGIISAEQFNTETTLNNINGAVRTQKMDLFDFGYALTVHKAQGSQAKKVVLFEERFKQMDDEMWRRWLYTAVTRAEEELVIFG
jgi:exodeoxyribonuclease-5